MLRRSVSSASPLVLFLASCLSLACGKITTPDGPPARTEVIQPTTEDPPPSPNTNSDAGTDPTDDNDDDEVPCGEEEVAGLSISIRNLGVECDDLRVIATADDFEEVLECPTSNGRCRCLGAYERPGTYVVTIETGDPPVELEQSRELDVEMDEDNCHVETESIALTARAPEEAEDAGVVDAGGEDVDPDPDPGEEDAGG